MINQFFHPHSFFSLLTLASFLIVWDISGWGLMNLLKLKIPEFFRPTLWLFGLSISVFFIFIDHIFSSYDSLTVILSAIIPSLIFIKPYLKSRQPRVLLNLLRHLKIPLLIFLPLFIWVLIKTSLPPYTWDEMAYHYISPFRLLNETTWIFGGLYQNVPRLLDTAFVALFSITKTYASARLLHFLIYFSTVISLYLFFSKNFSRYAAIAVFIALTYLNIPLITQSTLGYIDVGSVSFIILGLLSLFVFIKKPSSSLFILHFLFWALALGSKYNAIPPFLISSVTLFFFTFKSRHKITFSKIQLISALILTLFIGGYWYIKNFIVTGNPIYPFIFDCKTGGCGKSQDFFAWTLPFNTTNIPIILKQLFANSKSFSLAAVAVIITGVSIANKKQRTLIIAILSFLSLEYLLGHFFTGFDLRYFYHWVILLFTLFGFSIFIIVDRIKQKTSSLDMLMALSSLLVVAGLYFGSQIAIKTYRNFTHPASASYHELQYALGKTKLPDWLKLVLPRTYQAILWCESQDNPLPIHILDPDLIWSTREAQFHIYLTRCTHNVGTPVTPAYILSLDNCKNKSLTPIRLPKDSDKIYNMRQENRRVICSSQQILPNLYLYQP